MKRRILHKLVLSDISAVDRPCQEHARMAIMKRAPNNRPLTSRVAALTKRVAGLLSEIEQIKKFEESQHQRDDDGKFASGGGGGGSTDTKDVKGGDKAVEGSKVSPQSAGLFRKLLGVYIGVKGGGIAGALTATALMAGAGLNPIVSIAAAAGVGLYVGGKLYDVVTKAKASKPKGKVTFASDKDAERFLRELPKHLTEEQMQNLLSALKAQATELGIAAPEVGAESAKAGKKEPPVKAKAAAPKKEGFPPKKGATPTDEVDPTKAKSEAKDPLDKEPPVDGRDQLDDQDSIKQIKDWLNTTFKEGALSPIARSAVVRASLSTAIKRLLTTPATIDSSVAGVAATGMPVPSAVKLLEESLEILIHTREGKGQVEDTGVEGLDGGGEDPVLTSLQNMLDDLNDYKMTRMDDYKTQNDFKTSSNNVAFHQQMSASQQPPNATRKFAFYENLKSKE